MNALASLQQDFQAYVLSRRDDVKLVRSVVATSAADAPARLRVYAYAYRARLVEVLSKDFPGLRAMAADDFEPLAEAYVGATPSTHYNLRWYGERFAQFIRTTSPWSDTPALAEMAQFEWTFGLSFDAADEAPVQSSALETLAPEQWPYLRQRLHGAVHRLSLHWNVAAIRRAVDGEEALPALIEFDEAQTWVVSRRETAVRYRRANADEAAALDAVESGATFAEVCEVLCAWHEEDGVAMHAATLLKQWIHDQWVTEFLLPA
ncbi:MAG: DNA-binding domain-containing protein [Rudaea sp.]